MSKKIALLLCASLAAASAVPAFAAETLKVKFTDVSKRTDQKYSGIVHVRVSGTGFSDGPLLNDAFYNLPVNGAGPTVNSDGYYQLGFNTSKLMTYDDAQAVANIPGFMRPAYNSSNTYTFDLNVGTKPTYLFFGVTDQDFTDNGGRFDITVGSGALPEPATWAMLLVGFGMVGAGLRYRRKSTTARFA